MLKFEINRHRVHRVKTWIVGLLTDTGRTLAIFAAAILLGWLSSWYMVEIGSRLTTRRHGPWVAWTSAGRSDADPYTRAHFARAGTLPISAEMARNYLAHTDSDGRKLQSYCDYSVEGATPDVAWWSFSVFDDRGRLIPNSAERHSFTADSLARGPDGRLGITLSRDARHGNWVPTSGAGRLTLQLTMLEPRASSASDASATDIKFLPEIKRLSCK